MGYGVVDTRSARAFVELVRSLIEAGYPLFRDVIIGPPRKGADLAPLDGDFWFHTDGAFLPVPPRWVLIQVLQTDGGGALSLLDLTSFRTRLPNARFWFGQGHQGVEAPIFDKVGDLPLVRYRRDYMRALSANENETIRIHGLIEEVSRDRALMLGELEPGCSLLADNWRFLHRRAPFVGERSIRRLWLGSQEVA